MKSKQLKLAVVSAVFAALVFVLTYTLKVPTPTGYVHIGDAAIYLAACVLPTPYALVAAGLGGALSDLLGGYMQYVLPTFIIKALLTLVFTSKNEKMIGKRNLIALIPATAITVVGYYLTHAVLISVSAESFFAAFFSGATWVSALSSIPGDAVQAVTCAIVFVILGFALDKLGFKKRLKL